MPFHKARIFRINSNGEIKEVAGNLNGQSESRMGKGQCMDGPMGAIGSVEETAPWQGEGRIINSSFAARKDFGANFRHLNGMCL